MPKAIINVCRRNTAKSGQRNTATVVIRIRPIARAIATHSADSDATAKQINRPETAHIQRFDLAHAGCLCPRERKWKMEMRWFIVEEQLRCSAESATIDLLFTICSEYIESRNRHTY